MKSNKNHKRTTREEQTGLFGACAYGVGVSVICGVCLIAAFSAVCMLVNDPSALIGVFGYLSAAITFFLAGMLSAKKKRAAIPCGVLSGCALTLISLALSLCLPDTGGVSVGVGIGVRVALVLLCIIGAILGSNGRRGRKA